MAGWPPKKNTAFNMTVKLFTTAGALVTNPGTVTAKISKDYGDYADVGTVSEEDSTYGQIKLALTNTEMNADVIDLYVVDNTSGCIPFTCTIYTDSAQVGENNAILAHTDYGNAKLVRSTTPAETLNVGNANTLSGHDPGEAIMGATDLGTGAGLTSLATQTSVNTVDGVVDALLALMTNKRGIRKESSTWYLFVRNTGDDADILKKALKDKNGDDITDIAAGAIAAELASSV